MSGIDRKHISPQSKSGKMSFYFTIGFLFSRGRCRVLWLYLTKTLQVNKVNKTLQAVCIKCLLCASTVKDLPLKKAYLNHEGASVVTPLHRPEGLILNYGPDLPGEG